MPERRFDVVVVGAGPSGSVTALLLARAGARVALVDKASFPRDKACGDLIGPRAVARLAQLGVEPVGGQPVRDILLVGPTGHRVWLPAFPSRDHGDHALALPRSTFDAQLRAAALDAGAAPVAGRCTGLADLDAPTVVEVHVCAGDRATTLHAGAVVGADGSTSIVARAAGLVDPTSTLSGFALRGYVRADVADPVLVLREERPWRAFPGYGWLFPGCDGQANVGIGLGFGDRRGESRQAGELFEGFCDQLRELGLLNADTVKVRRTGGWLKMGSVGTIPARGRVLLVGDAAGLVNPLQGEGIGPAIDSGRLAAQALLGTCSRPASCYRQLLREQLGPYLAAAAPLHAGMLAHPMLAAAAGRALTAPGLGAAAAGTWSLFWNDLAVGAEPGPAATAARLLRSALALAPTRTGRRVLAGAGPD